MRPAISVLLGLLIGFLVVDVWYFYNTNNIDLLIWRIIYIVILIVVGLINIFMRE